MPRKSTAVTPAPNKQTKENEDAYLSIVICGCLGMHPLRVVFSFYEAEPKELR